MIGGTEKELLIAFFQGAGEGLMKTTPERLADYINVVKASANESMVNQEGQIARQFTPPNNQAR